MLFTSTNILLIEIISLIAAFIAMYSASSVD